MKFISEGGPDISSRCQLEGMTFLRRYTGPDRHQKISGGLLLLFCSESGNPLVLLFQITANYLAKHLTKTLLQY